MTQVYKYRADVGSNWKLYIDAFAEFYHAPVLHSKQYIGRRIQQAHGLRLRGASTTTLDGPHGMVSSWGGMAPPKDLEHGQADRADPSQRQLRAVGPPRHLRAGSAAAGAQPVPPAGRGASTRTSSSPTSWSWCGRPAGTSRTTTGRPPTTGTSSRARSTSFRPRRRAIACARSWPRSRSRSSGCRTATRSRRRRRCSSRACVSHFPLERPGDPPAPPPQDGRRLRGCVRGGAGPISHDWRPSQVASAGR